MLRTTVVITLQKRGTSYPAPHTIIEDIIRYKIAQIKSANKAYIPCFLATINK